METNLDILEFHLLCQILSNSFGNLLECPDNVPGQYTKGSAQKSLEEANVFIAVISTIKDTTLGLLRDAYKPNITM